MEINICSSDNTVFFSILIKRRRLLNTLLLGAPLRKPMLPLVLNSDELSAHLGGTAQLQAGVGGGWRKSMGNVRREVRLKLFSQLAGAGAAAAAKQRESCSREGEGRHFGRVGENEFCLLLN